MAEKKIQYSEIIEKEAIPKLVDGLKEVEKQMEAVAKSAGKVVEESANIAKSKPLQGFENLKEVQTNLDKMSKAVVVLREAEKKRAEVLTQKEKLEKKLANLRTEEAKDNAKIQAQIVYETKLLRDRANATRKVIADKAKEVKKAEAEQAKAVIKAEGEKEKATKKAESEQAKAVKKAEEAKAKALKEATKEAEFQADAFKVLTKNTKEAKEEFQKLAAQFGENSDEAKKAYEQYDKLNKKLTSIRNADIKARNELKKALEEEKQAQKQAAKDAELSANAYKKLTKETNEAQAEYKKLAAEFGATSKEAKDAYKQFIKLDNQLREINDAARDGRRDVGRYRIATEKLGKSMKALQAIGLVTMLAKVGEFFSANESGGAALEKVFGRLTVALKVFVARVVTLMPQITATFQASFVKISIWAKNVEVLFLKAAKLMGEATKREVEKASAELIALEKRYADIVIITKEDIVKAFEGMGEEIDKLVEKNDKLIDNTLVYRREVIKLTKAEADLLAERERLQAIADDDSISLQERVQGTKDLMLIEEQIAQNQIKQAEGALNIAKQQQAVALNNISAEEVTAQAYVALQEAKSNALAIQLENASKMRHIEIDQLEADLDILLDVSDRRKIIAERLVLDETATYEERAEALKKATKDIDTTFKEEAKLIEERAKVAIDMDKIIGTEDTKELNEYVKSLKLSEREQNRLREIIIERLMATRDFVEAQEDLNKATDEQSILNTDIIAQEEALQALQIQGIDLARVLEILQEKRTQNEIDDLEFRLSKAKEGSAEFLKIQKELNDKLLAQAKDKADKQAKIEEEEKARRIATAESTADFLLNLSNRVAEQRIARIDKAIEDSAAQEQVLLEVVKGGSEEALKALEFERKKQAELALQREKEIQAQARRELGLSAAKIFSAKVAGGTPAGQALAETGSEILALQSLVNSLPTFRDGTEDTGNGGSLDKDGGFLSVLHPNEKVFKKEDASIIPTGMSNLEVALAARESKMQERQVPAISFDVVVNELKEVKKAIKDKPVMSERVFDSVRQESIATIQRGNRLERNHRRIGING